MNTPSAAADRPASGLQRWRKQWREHLGHTPSATPEVVLSQRRIYVLPTARGLSVLVLVVILILIAINYQLSLAYVVAFLLGGILQSALIISYRSLSGLHVSRGPLATAQAGEPLQFAVGLYAPERAREGIRLASGPLRRLQSDGPPHAGGGAHSAPQHLAPEERLSARLQFPVTGRGLYALPRLKIECTAPYGLVRAWSYVRFDWFGAVFPAPEPAAPPVPREADEGADQAARTRGEDSPHDPDGLRDYQLGDSLRRVAWKQVAKSGKWYTRSSEQEGQSGDLLLDWSADALRSLPDDEARLARLQTWLDHARNNQARFRLQLPNAQAPLGQTAADYQRAALALAAWPQRPPAGLTDPSEEPAHVR